MSVKSASIMGIHLGMPAADAAARARTAGARFAGFLGSHVTYTSRQGTLYVHLDEEGRVVSVAGPRLELDSLPVAGSGSPRSELRAVLGEPDHKSPVEFERLVEEMEQDSPDLASGLEGLAEGREFWWYWGRALSVLVDRRGAHSFNLQPPAR